MSCKHARRALLVAGLQAALLLTPSLLLAKPMKPVYLNDPQTVYPDQPNMLELARWIMRDDAKSLEAALKAQPGLVNTLGRHNVGLLMLAVANVKPRSLSVLMRLGADPFYPCSKISNLGRPASYALAHHSSPDIFRVLLDEGLDLNGGFDDEGPTLLKVAVMASDDARLKQLIATRKVNLNLADSVQKTPLIVAINSMQYDRALLLLDSGADPHLGCWNMLEDLVKRHDKWAAGSPQDRDRQELIRRMRALGMTETTVMQPAPQRKAGTRHMTFTP